MKQNAASSIRHYSREMVRELGFLENPYQALGLNIAQVHVMIECESLGSLNQNELAQRLKVNKSYVSRLVKQLVAMELVNCDKQRYDQRIQSISLTKKGQEILFKVNQLALRQVTTALDYLSEDQQSTVISGLQYYADALRRSRLRSDINIRLIREGDNLPLETVIKHVLAEFGANKPGFAYEDAELSTLFEAYQGENKRYFIVEKGSQLLGGAGVGPLAGATQIGELKKMYLSLEARGLGLGSVLLNLLVDEAKKCGYKQLYLETLSTMKGAINLYQKHGFKKLDNPLGQTGHFGCNIWMLKELE